MYTDPISKKPKYMNLTPAPPPDNILWENIYYSTQSKYLRRCGSVFFTAILLFFSFILIMYIRKQKDDTIEKYPKVDCSEYKFQKEDKELK